MKKALFKILVLCMIVCSALCVFTACGDDSLNASFNGTYYLYKNNRYDETNYIKLTNGKFERLQTISGVAFPFISGIYEITDETIDFYAAEGGEKAKLYSGTITEGVMKVNSDTFCMKGYTPQGKISDNTANNDNNNQSSGQNNNTPSGGQDNDTNITYYTVTFDTNGGSAVSSQTIVKNGKVTKPTNPTRSGYIFIDWYKDFSFTEKWNFTTDIVTGDTVLYAKWQEILPENTEYDVTFYLNYDGATSEIKSTVNGKVSYKPERSGYVFNGWYEDEDLSTPWNDAEVVTASGLKLYAEWVLDENIKGQLSAPIVSIDDNVFKWSSVTDASDYKISYKLTTEDEYAPNVTVYSTSWTFPNSLIAGVYNVRIFAGGDGRLTINSPYVNKTYYHKCLAKASGAYIDDNTFYLKWNAVKNATSYNVQGESEDDDFETTVYNTYFDMSGYKAGRYRITITAMRDGYVSSEYTADLNHKYLAAPSGLQYDLQTSCLNWQAVKYATAYNVYKNTTTNFMDVTYELLDTVTDTTYNMEYFDVGQHGIKVEAIADGFISSYSTNTVNKIKLKTPTIICVPNIDDLSYAISWAAIKGANKYYVKIGDNEIETTDTSCILTYNSTLWGDYDEAVVSVYAFDSGKNALQSNLSAEISLIKNFYGLTVSSVDNAMGSVMINGTTDTTIAARSGANYTVTVTLLKIGYIFSGWFDGNTLLSNELSYTFTMPNRNITYTAKWVVKDEMLNFNFTSSATTCEITGIKDKTVTEIIVPNYVTNIELGAFSDCSSLENITIPFVGATLNGTNYAHFGYIFGARNYYYNSSCVPTSLKTVVITGGNSIGDYAFYHCTSLTSITISDSVTSIGNYAFYRCSGLTSITIGNSVTSIGSSAFHSCSSLTSVTIGIKVASIGNFAFYGCSSLTSINVVANNNNYKSIDGNLYSKDGKDLIQYATGKTATTFTISNSVTGIGEYAFSNCSGLTSINIPNGVTSIGDSAFYNCSSLTSVSIPDSVTSIGECAFENCASLTNVTIGIKVTSIGECAFYRCSGLTSINVSEFNKNYKSIAGNLYSKDGKDLIQYAIGKTATTFTISNSVTSIGSCAFYGCRSLTSVTIGNSVKSIGNNAFNGCSKLTSIIIPDSVTSIGEATFSNCSSLKSITIGNSVTSIGQRAFLFCRSLMSVTFKNTSGWIVSTVYDMSNAVSLSNSDLTNPTTLTLTYVGYYWERS